MKHFLIAERYALGLSAAITDDADLRAATQALLDLRRVYHGHHELQNALNNPALRLSRREAILETILAHMEAPEKVRRLLALMLRKGRIAHVEEVATIFGGLADERLGRVRATVTTAAPLDETHEQRIHAAMEKHTGKQVRLETEVDPEILGGVVARVDGKVIDGSLRTRLAQLREALLAEEQ